MATYVNDLRLKEIGTGESSGTWGTETNVNLELIGEALSFGTEAITTNADTHTSTVADGSTDPARSMYIKYTGTLDSACTITIAPNTLSRLHFIENGTSGSQNIIISQGSGANVTIPPGDVKVVYLDGAGSGAAVVDAFASLSTVDLKVQDDLTVTDDVSIGGALTLTGNGDFNGDLDVDGTTNLDVVDIDGAVDMASTLQVDGAITTSDGMVITTADNSDTLSLISTDADASHGPNLRYYRNSGSPANNDGLANIKFVGRNNNSQDVEYAEQEYFITDVTDGAEDGLANFNVMTNGTALSYLQMRGETGSLIVNEASADIDFRVETNANTHGLFVDGGNDRVVVGGDGTTNRGNPKFLIELGSFNYLEIKGASDSTANGILFSDGGAGTPHGIVGYDHATDSMNFFTNGNRAMDITSAGAVLIGNTDGTDPLVVVDSASDSVTARFKNTNADALPAIISIEKDSASPADDDFVGQIQFAGSNDNNQQPTFVDVLVQATDVSDGAEDGNIAFKTMTNGTLSEKLKITEGGTINQRGTLTSTQTIPSDSFASFCTGQFTVSSSGDGTTTETLFNLPASASTGTGQVFIACENSGANVSWGYILNFHLSNNTFTVTAVETGNSQGTTSVALAKSSAAINVSITYAGGLGGNIQANCAGHVVVCNV
jgi:hypothetical protein